ncbi:MAG: transposon-encoded TnpW family protein [Oscillospiraceae bacterium]|nr:transposon-encoded TnpW family protein [Oscillospiraceae bacterium]HBT63531.1 hypothetical protein [Oscillospiraceae bacterium]HZK38785.1 transposon-encoded TnpW family protein [Clostridia bacterium]
MNKTETTQTKLKPISKPGFFIKRIGHTTYRVGVHFSTTSAETARDKISRLIRNESTVGGAGKAVGE